MRWVVPRNPGIDKPYYRQLVSLLPFGFVLLFFLFMPFRRPTQPVHRPLLVTQEFSVRLDF